MVVIPLMGFFNALIRHGKKIHTNPFSLDCVVSFALGASVVLPHFQWIRMAMNIDFKSKGDFYSIFSFIKTIGKKAHDWFFKQFELVKSSKPNVYFLNQVMLSDMIKIQRSLASINTRV
jgi:hypothetical protein